LSILLPTAFFAALDRAVAVPITPPLISDLSRSNFLKLSRGISIVLLIVFVPPSSSSASPFLRQRSYVCSRIFLHNPPGNQALTDRHDTPEGLKHEEKRLKEAVPEISSWACLVMLFITVGILAPTAEWVRHVVASSRFLQLIVTFH
jgi:Ca2+:H+ antiporter